MSRYKDIRKEVQYMVDVLYKLHDATDPRKGKASEERKLQRAQRAIGLWWYVYARLMQWAQSQIIGYEMARLNPACQKILENMRGGELDENSHELEHLGSLYVANRPAHFENPSPDGVGAMDDEALQALSDEMEKKDVGLDDEALRRVIVRLLLSTSTESSVWRFPLQHALSALNSGEVDNFFKPSRRRRRGQSHQLDWARSDAIKHVYYLVGKGVKKHVAQRKVGDALAVSTETLRTWEKELQKDDWFAFIWDAAKLAGWLEESPEDSAQDLPVSSHDGMHTNIEMVSHVVRELHGEASLPKVKERLRKHHKSR
jgi:hypothetical protein